MGMMFDWVEYLVFSVTLGLSGLIGVYFGFCKGGQDTVDGYLLGSKEMGVFPISMSLIASFISAITILGLPTEIYTFGTQYTSALICFFLVCAICIFIFLPVFYKLQAVSVYEYMELRFDKKVRKLVSFLYTISLFFYIPVVLYGPALALNQVSGLSIETMALTVSSVCIFYTTFGGLKAVVWADTLQGFIMFLASIVVAVVGTYRVGGLSTMVQAASQGDRLEFFNFDPDPTLRTTFWTVVIGQTVAWTAGGSISPSAIQRYVALNSISKARKTVVFFTTGCLVFFLLSVYMGLVIYTRYQGCDPITTGAIKRPDQILPYFIMEALGDIKGLSGLFLAGVVCASLSTMSTGLNTVAGTLYEDFIEPIMGKTTEFRASLILKFLVIFFGILCLLLVMVIEKLGNLIELSNAFGGLTSGSILGIFILGLFLPPANSIGALVGGLGSLGVMSWILVGSRSALARGDVVYPVKPIRVDLCPNQTALPTVTEVVPVHGKVLFLFEVSFFYYTLMGCTVAVVLGLLISCLTGRTGPVDRRLLTPPVRKFYRPVPPPSATEKV